MGVYRRESLFGLDIGRLGVEQGRLQTRADAASLAGVDAMAAQHDPRRGAWSPTSLPAYDSAECREGREVNRFAVVRSPASCYRDADKSR